MNYKLKTKKNLKRKNMETKNDQMTAAKKEITITRIINAPRELVFKAWIDPKHLKEWWGPKGFTNPSCELDVRPGGKIRIHMSSPQFPDHWMGGEFLEIKEPEKLVFVSRAFEDEKGNWGLEGVNTILFEDMGGKTKITVHAALMKLSPEYTFAADGMNDGWSQSIDKLNSYLENL
jgi:uncharacterized protein YndB with AHSA1/START domain